MSVLQTGRFAALQVGTFEVVSDERVLHNITAINMASNTGIIWAGTGTVYESTAHDIYVTAAATRSVLLGIVGDDDILVVAGASVKVYQPLSVIGSSGVSPYFDLDNGPMTSGRRYRFGFNVDPSTLTLRDMTDGLDVLSVGADGSILAGAATFNPIYLNRLSDATSYGLVSFNGVYTLAGSMGVFGRLNGILEGLYLGTPASTSITFTIAGTDTYKFLPTGDIATLVAGKGVILKTPDGAHTWRLAISNAGAVTLTNIT